MAKTTINADRCKGCGLCVEVCPKKLIEISSTILNAKGYNPAVMTNEEACIGCAMCAKTCPDCAIRVEK